MIVILLTFIAAVLAIQGTRKLIRSSLSVNPKRPPLPPGPVPVPFLGNVFGMNKDAPHLTYTAWSKTYGNIIYTRILGQDIIVLNSEEVAIALLEKRSQKYSDRPALALAELFGWEWATTSALYGSRFRLHRRLLHRVFHANAALAYRQEQLQRAYEMLAHLSDDPMRYAEHFTSFSAAVVMSVTYGYDMKSDGETFVTSMKRAIDIFVRVVTPEMSAVCIAFPFVKALPSWFPGMGFKSKAAECRRLTSEAVSAPYVWVKRRVEEGTAVPSLVANAIIQYRLYDGSKQPELVQAVKEVAGTLYAASVESTSSTLLIFIYLMMNHPQVQHRAYTEIDRVVGRQRLPDFGDRDSLPYVDAVLRETIRWHPVGPLGLPRATSEDDIYEGYYIQQGAMVITNLWAISHDEKRYPNPERFIPERFLREDGTLNEDKVAWIFGFGRRICPGRHVADASLWCAMVCILAFFRIEKTEGSENVKWATGLSTHPFPFPCRFVPRDDKMDREKLVGLIYANCAEV